MDFPADPGLDLPVPLCGTWAASPRKRPVSSMGRRPGSAPKGRDWAREAC